MQDIKDRRLPFISSQVFDIINQISSIIQVGIKGFTLYTNIHQLFHTYITKILCNQG